MMCRSLALEDMTVIIQKKKKKYIGGLTQKSQIKTSLSNRKATRWWIDDGGRNETQ